jgi:hypothetical protein
MYIADLVCERNARVNEAFRGRRGQVRSQHECFALRDSRAAALCGLPFTLNLADYGIYHAAVEIGSLDD